ncbi:Apolipoprotein O-like protein [Tupaia chinensis]|uniref:MICOS complex subunit n=2 Tax=Tupaia chinensis TaxID=246437 RepID=L9L234_TUPCH|nr:Apolipoprotein O-like protein [Tupaia chinensis]
MRKLAAAPAGVTSASLGWCRGAYVFVKTGITDTVQLGKDAYVYLKNPPPDFLPKMGVITVLGLAGLISARKESKFKRIAYPLGLATLGATVCYPVQSVRVAKVTGKNTYAASQWIVGAVRSLWRKGNRRESMPERTDKTKLERSAEIERPAKAAQVLVLPDSAPAPELGCDSEAAAGAAPNPPDPKLTDHPQAHPEVVGAFCARS